MNAHFLLFRILMMTTAMTASLSSISYAADSTAAPTAAIPGEEEVQLWLEHCTVERFIVHSNSMGREIRAVVVLPPEYSQKLEARYPVLYALHGGGAPYDSWSRMIPLCLSLGDHPMVLVCFDGDPFGWFIDSPKKPESQFATFFFNELIPYIDSHYRTRPDGGSRGVTGFSMGGYGAFHYMLMHPEMFASVSSLSGSFDILSEKENCWKPDETLEALLGPLKTNKAAYLQCGIYNRIEERIAQGVHLPPMFLQCGTEDIYNGSTENRTLLEFLIEQNKKLGKAGKETLVIQFRESPGKHDWPFWRDASDGVADFHWRSFQQAAKAAPTAMHAASRQD